MTYTRLQSEYGIEIDRGALASGFRENEHRPGSEAFVNPHASWRGPKPPPIQEDLSRLIPKPRLPAFRVMLDQRGETLDGLSQKSGLARETIRQLVSSPKRYSDASKRRLMKVLTRQEKAFIMRCDKGL